MFRQKFVSHLTLRQNNIWSSSLSEVVQVQCMQNYNICNFEISLRKNTFGFMQRLKLSTHTNISTLRLQSNVQDTRSSSHLRLQSNVRH